MYGRQDAEQGSVSAENLYGVNTVYRKPGRSLRSLMKELGDDEIQILKIDVGGSEYTLLPTLDLPAMGVRVLCIELHHNRTSASARELIDHLALQRFAPVHRKHPSSFTFVRP